MMTKTKTTMTEDPPPCRVANIMLLREDGALLLQLRDDIPTIASPGHWSIPGGSLEADETAQQAAAREFEEETGYRASPQSYRLFVVELFSDADGRVHEHNCFSIPYDNVQEIRCFEGQEMRWTPRDEAAGLRLAPGQAAVIAALGPASGGAAVWSAASGVKS
jgi:8-oxo-dGTP diphosphatase